MRDGNAALRHLDEAVTKAGGIALRYGTFYGAANDGLVEPVRKRQFPIVGEGGGIWSFVHLDDAAAATVLALERHAAGVYNVVDDEPAPVREWLPVFAEVLGAKPPRRFPRWLARLLAGEAVVMMETGVPGRLEREGQARARLGAEVSELASGLPRRLPIKQAGSSPHIRGGRGEIDPSLLVDQLTDSRLRVFVTTRMFPTRALVMLG